MQQKESFISIEDTEANGDPTPAFGREPEEKGSDSGIPRTATLSRHGTVDEFAEPNRGILVHSLQSLFDEISKREKIENRIFIIKCAYFEIYNDQVFDLLNETFIHDPEPL